MSRLATSSRNAVDAEGLNPCNSMVVNGLRQNEANEMPKGIRAAIITVRETDGGRRRHNKRYNKQELELHNRSPRSILLSDLGYVGGADELGQERLRIYFRDAIRY